MQNKFAISLIVLFLVLSTSCQQGCPKETIAEMQTQFKTEYFAWKEALNYMDHEVIQTAYKNLDSTFKEMQTCHTYPIEFMNYADSVSQIFTVNKIEENKLDKAQQILQRLEGIIATESQ